VKKLKKVMVEPMFLANMVAVGFGGIQKKIRVSGKMSFYVLAVIVENHLNLSRREKRNEVSR